MGEMIQIQDTKAKAFLAESGKRSAPGILIMHAWWGLNAFIKGLAYRLAKAGYTALAIDYYSGGIATTIEEAKLLRSRMDRKASNKMIQRATRQFLELPAVAGSSIGVIGFSLGCGFALEIARRFPDDTAAIVLFYGTGGGKLDRVKGSILGHFAENDSWGADAKKVHSLQARCEQAGVPFEDHTYPGTVHWFFEDDRPDSYQPKAAALAWSRTLEFLRERLFEQPSRRG